MTDNNKRDLYADYECCLRKSLDSETAQPQKEQNDQKLINLVPIDIYIG